MVLHGVDDALQPRRADPALLRPRELGLHRPRGAEAQLVDGVRPRGNVAGVREGDLGVDAPDGKWYYAAFEDAYPGGRIPVLAPVTWGADGFPALAISNGVWGSAYAMPAARHALPALTGTDTFSGTALGAAWEWNHNPDTGKFVVDDGLTLAAATVTTAATGSYAASVPVAAANARKIYLRGTVDIRPGTGRTGSFSYSLDGTRFTPLGSGVVLNSDWRFFMGYRWGIFNVSFSCFASLSFLFFAPFRADSVS